MTDDAHNLEPLATAATTAAARIATDALARPGAIEFAEKSTGKQAHSDLVSEVDVACQRAVRDAVLAERPGDAFLGEEDLGDGDPSTVASMSEVAPGRVVWVVDPLDATLNYSYGRGEWAVSVCARLDGRPVASAAHGPRLHAGDGVRSLRVADTDLAHALVEVGRGRPSKLPWLVSLFDAAVRDIRRGGCAAAALCDVAAGRLDVCVQADLGEWDWAAGAHLVEAAGGTVVHAGPFLVACHPSLADQVAEMLAAFGDQA